MSRRRPARAAARGATRSRGRVDPLTFVAELVQALAWPMTVLGIVAVLRRPLLALVPLLTRLRFEDLGFDVSTRRPAEAGPEAAADYVRLAARLEQSLGG